MRHLNCTNYVLRFCQCLNHIFVSRYRLYRLKNVYCKCSEEHGQNFNIKTKKIVLEDPGGQRRIQELLVAGK